MYVSSSCVGYLTSLISNQMVLLIVLITVTTIYIYDMFASGDILEVGAQWAIAKKDVAAFERYMAQLKCYYLDYR